MLPKQKQIGFLAILVRVDHSEIDSNSSRRLGQHSNAQHCDVEAIDGEDSPLQSKRSSRLTIQVVYLFIDF